MGTSKHHRSSRDVDYLSSRPMNGYAPRDLSLHPQRPSSREELPSHHHHHYDRHDERQPRYRDESRLSPRENSELRRQAIAEYSARGQRFYGGRPPEDMRGPPPEDMRFRGPPPEDMRRTERKERAERLRERTKVNEMMADTGEMTRTQAYARNTMAHGAHTAEQLVKGRYDEVGRGALRVSAEAGKTVVSTLLNGDAHPLAQDYAHETVGLARDSVGAFADGDLEGGAKLAVKSLLNAGKTVATAVLTQEPYRAPRRDMMLNGGW